MGGWLGPPETPERGQIQIFGWDKCMYIWREEIFGYLEGTNIWILKSGGLVGAS